MKSVALLILQHNQNVLLEKRPTKGIWGGLWSLPEIAADTDFTTLKKYCRDTFQLTIQKPRIADVFRHTFTHFHLDILPLFIPCKTRTLQSERIWYNPQTTMALGLPAPVKKLLESLC